MSLGAGRHARWEFRVLLIDLMCLTVGNTVAEVADETDRRSVDLDGPFDDGEYGLGSAQHLGVSGWREQVSEPDDRRVEVSRRRRYCDCGRVDRSQART